MTIMKTAIFRSDRDGRNLARLNDGNLQGESRTYSYVVSRYVFDPFLNAPVERRIV